MSQTDLAVRTATPADVDPLLSLISSAYRGEESRKGWTTEADLLTGDRIDAAGLLAKISDPNGVMLLTTATATDPDPSASASAVESGSGSSALLACCELRRRDDGIGFFGLFAVEPRRQGSGLGRQILQIAESYARETMGLEKLEMQVIFTRAELIAWYMRRGYERTGERRPFPYEQLVSGAAALRDDLYFEILEKDLVDIRW
ncbi:hypothetical protein LTR24_003814 [Lithohypha guttulata]|uniref:N-acetyltransferase domain-containing protein n=1 Tax=Lithohypha guttulata TaxID=1690604 RepID=A0ABR0KDM2_9EURO|nr:hypothetical protein LTR24_003814 [Lithohypha guttulata]